MIFKKDSQIVRSYVILILAGQMTYEEVPNLFNLRVVVAEVLGLETEKPTEPEPESEK